MGLAPSLVRGCVVTPSSRTDRPSSMRVCAGSRAGLQASSFGKCRCFTQTIKGYLVSSTHLAAACAFTLAPCVPICKRSHHLIGRYASACALDVLASRAWKLGLPGHFTWNRSLLETGLPMVRPVPDDLRLHHFSHLRYSCSSHWLRMGTA